MMSAQSRVLIPATTSAFTSDTFGISGTLQTAVLLSDGLLSEETVNVEVLDAASGNFILWLPGSGNQMNSTVNTIKLENWFGTFRVTKSATDNPVSVSITMIFPQVGGAL